MPIYDVTTERHGEYEHTDIVAHYFASEDEFTTFKDAQHKQLATFANRSLVSIVRTDPGGCNCAGRGTFTGSITVGTSTGVAGASTVSRVRGDGSREAR